MMIMKWEIQTYTGISLLIICLFIYHSNLFKIKNEKPISEVQILESFNQLHVDLECNIYLVEGEAQRILVEGPTNKLKKIVTINNEGSITIRQNGKELISTFFNFFDTNKYHINIYISVNNLDNFTIIPCDEESIFRYIADDIIGLSIKQGNTLTLESKNIKSCV